MPVLDDREEMMALRARYVLGSGLVDIVCKGAWIGLLVALSVPADAQDSPIPGGYTLFDPVPDLDLRSFSPDRPGKAHSAQTLDAGHVDVESDFFNYTYDRSPSDGTTTRAYSVGTPLFKVGVTDWADVEFALQLYNMVRTSGPPGTPSSKASGFGDFSVGGKINLFGDDGGDSSLAIIPFIKLPTGAAGISNGVVESTLNLPYNFMIGEGWSGTLEPAVGVQENRLNSGYHAEYSFAALVSHSIFLDNLSFSLELYGETSGDRHIASSYTVDTSFQWLATPWLQLDVGIYIGLNKAAADYNPYTGIAIRY